MKRTGPTLTDQQAESLRPLISQLAVKRWKRAPVVELEDLVAVGFLALAKVGTRFDPKRGIKLITFAYRAIDGAIQDEIERQLNHTTRISNEDPLVLDLVAVETPLESGSIRRQLQRISIDLLERVLPDEQALVLVRVYFEGMTISRVSQELQAPVKHIQLLHDLGISRLRKAIT